MTQIAIGGKNKFLINGRNALPKRVQDMFKSVQLNVDNPHFLIMQGRITKVGTTAVTDLYASQKICAAQPRGGTMCRQHAPISCTSTSLDGSVSCKIREQVACMSFAFPRTIGSQRPPQSSVVGAEREADADAEHAGGGSRHAHV